HVGDPLMATKPASKKPATKKAVAKTTVAAKKAAKAAPKTEAAAEAQAEHAARRSLRKPPAPGVAELKFGIESAFERRAMLTIDEIEGSTKTMVNRVIDGLESGEF